MIAAFVIVNLIIPERNNKKETENPENVKYAKMFEGIYEMTKECHYREYNSKIGIWSFWHSFEGIQFNDRYSIHHEGNGKLSRQSIFKQDFGHVDSLGLHLYNDNPSGYYDISYTDPVPFPNNGKFVIKEEKKKREEYSDYYTITEYKNIYTYVKQ